MKQVAIVTYSGISLFHLAVPAAIFDDVASQHTSLFQVKVCAENSGKIESMNGLSITIEESISSISQADIIIFPSWEPDRAPSKQLIALLKQAHQENKLIVGLCLGAYVLAYAGLLDGKRATSHWKCSEDFSSRFPNIHFESNPLYIEQGNLITSAGSAASIDCCLYIVKHFYGVKVANQIARVMVASPERTGGQNQFIEQPMLARASDERLAKLTDHILSNITDSFSLAEVAKFCSMSVRSFSRHFKATNGVNFTQWLANARLNYSLELLESSNISITQIAQNAGFSSEQNFRKQFKQRFDTTPNAWRGIFNSQSIK